LFFCLTLRHTNSTLFPTRRSSDLAIQQVKAAQLLLGLGEGTVGHQPLAVADLDRRRGADRLERVAALHQASLLDVLTEGAVAARSEEHTSELQSRGPLVCRLLLEK